MTLRCLLNQVRHAFIIAQEKTKGKHGLELTLEFIFSTGMFDAGQKSLVRRFKTISCEELLQDVSLKTGRVELLGDAVDDFLELQYVQKEIRDGFELHAGIRGVRYLPPCTW